MTRLSCCWQHHLQRKHGRYAINAVPFTFPHSSALSFSFFPYLFAELDDAVGEDVDPRVVGKSLHAICAKQPLHKELVKMKEMEKKRKRISG